MTLTLIVVAAAVVVLLLLIVSGIRVVHEYERGVVFRFGRMHRVTRPGMRWLLPLGVDRMVRVDARINALQVPSHEAITRDQVLVRVVADVYYQVVNPQLAVTKVADFREATAKIAQSQLRSLLGKVMLSDLLSMRSQLNPTVMKLIDDEVEPWGVRIASVELNEVQLSDAMQRAIARQAEADRERQTKIAVAEGELHAARALVDAATMMAERPTALQLRYLQTLSEIGTGRSTVVVFPVPLDLMQSWVEMRARMRNGNGESPQHLAAHAPQAPAQPGAAEAQQRSAAVGAPVAAAHATPPPAPPPKPPEWPAWYRPR